VYLLRVVEGQGANPKANIPTVALPAAEPRHEAALAAVAEAFTQPEYVYLLRVVEAPTPQTYPKANMPTVALPAAAPLRDAALAAVAEAFTQPEYVYLSRVVEAPTPQTYPKANIPTVALPAAAPLRDAALAAAPDDTTQPENVYLSRVVEAEGAFPKANIAIAPTNEFPAVGHNPAFCQPTIWSIVHTPDAAPHWYGPDGVIGVLVMIDP
jgi:hypothetical protein